MKGSVIYCQRGERWYEFKQSHGYRKFFETYAGTVMHPYKVKLLMDHRLDVEASYWKPTEMQFLDDYLKAVPKLTVNNNQDIDKSILQKEVAELKQKSEQQNKEKEKEAEETKRRLAELEASQKEQEERIKSISQIALKQAFKVIEKEV